MPNIFEDVPTGAPSSVRAGDFVQWFEKDLAAIYPPSSYGLAYHLVRQAIDAETIEIVAAQQDGSFLLSASSSDTAAYVPGVYSWAAVITRRSDTEKHTVKTGRITVLDRYGAGASDPRSHARRMLDQIEALLEGRAKSDVESYEIKGRKVSKMAPSELMRWRGHYRREVRLEEARALGKSTRQVRKVRFL